MPAQTIHQGWWTFENQRKCKRKTYIRDGGPLNSKEMQTKKTYIRDGGPLKIKKRPTRKHTSWMVDPRTKNAAKTYTAGMVDP